MADLKRHPDPVWERFFEFVFPCEEQLAREEVQQDLRRLGIDVGKAFSRVQQAVASARGKAELADARSRRLGVLTRIKEAVMPAVGELREHLKGLIAGKFSGTVQAAYYRKLETAATDEDLQSLLEDIHHLEALSEESDGGDTRAK
jgi:hypothetical protein